MKKPKLTDENYYEDTYYMDVSKFKRFLACEESALLPYGEPTTAMMVGSYVDRYVEGTLDAFIEENKDVLYSSRGATKGQLKKEFQKAQEICDYIDNDAMLTKFLSGEKQTIMTGEIFGVPWKIKMDSYSPHIAINDLKVMATITNSNGDYYDFIRKWGYDIQLAVYQEIVRQNAGEKLPTYIVAITKETPINSIIVHIPDNVLYQAMCRVEDNLPHIMDVVNGKAKPSRCEKCPHCIATKGQTKIISLNDII